MLDILLSSSIEMHCTIRAMQALDASEDVDSGQIQYTQTMYSNAQGSS